MAISVMNLTSLPSTSLFEFYPTYDYKAVGMAEHEKAQ
jgi:hypothetical protein